MVYLFIQMSAEMWQFDPHGDLYFDKAISFLKEMFNRWKEAGSSHEVTIVLFSRCFYDAEDSSEFPKEMQQCVQKSKDGLYEDFYRVVVQNERFDDWQETILQLTKIFTSYQKFILEYHEGMILATEGEEEGENCLKLPKATISSAARGNFLEVLNMSLNTFENTYLNRNLDRTGQQSIVITPGVGVFHVKRELSHITKQRIIDSGVGSDLICLGEPPLHASPLLIFEKDDGSQQKRCDHNSLALSNRSNGRFSACPTG